MEQTAFLATRGLRTKTVFVADMRMEARVSGRTSRQARDPHRTPFLWLQQPTQLIDGKPGGVEDRLQRPRLDDRPGVDGDNNAA
jgi:hypothetical protein